MSEQHPSAPHQEAGGCCSAAGSSVAALTGKQAPGAFRVNRPSVRRGLVRDVFDADGLVGRTGVRHQAAERVWSTPRSQARSRGRGGAAAVRGNRHRHGEGPPHCVPPGPRTGGAARRRRPGQAPTAMRRGARHRLDQTALTSSDQPSGKPPTVPGLAERPRQDGMRIGEQASRAGTEILTFLHRATEQRAIASRCGARHRASRGPSRRPSRGEVRPEPAVSAERYTDEELRAPPSPRVRSAAPIRPASLPSWAATIRASGR